MRSWRTISNVLLSCCIFWLLGYRFHSYSGVKFHRLSYFPRLYISHTTRAPGLGSGNLSGGSRDQQHLSQRANQNQRGVFDRKHVFWRQRGKLCNSLSRTHPSHPWSQWRLLQWYQEQGPCSEEPEYLIQHNPTLPRRRVERIVPDYHYPALRWIMVITRNWSYPKPV